MKARLVSLAIASMLAFPGHAADWVKVASEPEKRLELDQASVRAIDGGRKTAWTREVLSSEASERVGYLIARHFSRYDCAAKTIMPVRREFLSAQLIVLRDEAVSHGREQAARAGSVDEKFLTEVCKPAAEDVKRVAEAAAKAAIAARDKVARLRDAQRPTTKRAGKGRTPPWGYEGATGPEHWSRLSPEYADCASRRGQSPVDLRDAFKLDQPALEFDYRPAPLRVVDTGHTLQVNYAPGSHLRVAGQDYQLTGVHFHRPSEEAIDGKRYAMSAHLVHRDAGGRLAVVAVLLEAGLPHPLVEHLWTYLPLERDVEVAPPEVEINAADLVPEDGGYYTYMGSLTAPPCSPGVLWVVLKRPLQLGTEQIANFARLYGNNARPLQPAGGRVIKESR